MSAKTRIAGVVLAAGDSSRMGRPKQTLPFRGKTVLEAVVDTALRSSLARVVVVLGHRAAELSALLAGRDAGLVTNADYLKGQSSSTKLGLQAVRDDADAALFLLGDQPLVSLATIESLLEAYRQQPSPIIQPVFEGRRGNPVLFGRETFAHFAALADDQGARSLFKIFGERVRKIAVPDPYIHFDIDTEADYLLLQQLEEKFTQETR